MTTAGRPRPPAYRRDGDAWLIEIRLRELRQLFNHLDPAPFREQDLDPAAASYLEDAVREIGPGRALRIVVHLPQAEAATAEAREVPAAIGNYFDYRAEHTGLELRRLLRTGAVSLLIGLAFLAGCIALRQYLAAGGHYEVLAEGLLIIGWVGLWRPVEIFLYDWWPVRRRQRRFAALAVAEVSLATPGS